MSLQVNPEIPFPDLMRTAIIDKAVAWEIALSVTAALFAREKGSGGQELKIAMVDVAISFLGPMEEWPRPCLMKMLNQAPT
ncbi:MAG: hypothetical protein Ct9H90mP5_02330 [Acidimicrobiaceae bacterium]|nr:MAG: hypothetical protein Ct9H90mP5_02330 [Acidimicrobiaceae bacterium]